MARLRSAYDKKLDAGSVVLTGEQAKALVLTGEQAKALVLAVADSLRHGKHGRITKQRMVAAVEALNHVFSLGIEQQQNEEG